MLVLLLVIENHYDECEHEHDYEPEHEQEQEEKEPSYDDFQSVARDFDS